MRSVFLGTAPVNDSQESSEENQRIFAILEREASRPGPLLPVLHAIQNQLGFIPEYAVPIVAQALNLSRAEVHGVISFYHLFRTSPPGKRTLYICRAEACQSMGARALESHAKQSLGVSFHGTTQDGRYSLEPIYCLGNCACSPSVMIDKTVYGKVTPERLDELLAEESGPEYGKA